MTNWLNIDKCSILKVFSIQISLIMLYSIIFLDLCFRRIPQNCQMLRIFQKSTDFYRTYSVHIILNMPFGHPKFLILQISDSKWWISRKSAEYREILLIMLIFEKVWTFIEPRCVQDFARARENRQIGHYCSLS